MVLFVTGLGLVTYSLVHTVVLYQAAKREQQGSSVEEKVSDDYDIEYPSLNDNVIEFPKRR